MRNLRIGTDTTKSDLFPQPVHPVLYPLCADYLHQLFRLPILSAFAVRGLMGLRDSRLTFHEKKLQEFKFGSLKGAISIYMKGEQIEEILHSFDRELTIPGMMAGEK